MAHRHETATPQETSPALEALPRPPTAENLLRSILDKHFSAEGDGEASIDAAVQAIFDHGFRLPETTCHHASDSTDDGVGDAGGNERVRIVLAEEDFRSPRTIDPHSTLVAKCGLPKGVTKALWQMYKNPASLFTLYALWAVGQIMAILTFLGKVPKWAYWISLAGLPAILLSILHLNVDLLKYLLRSSFEVYFLLVMIAAFGAAYAVIFNLDERCAALPVTMISFAYIALDDAHHPSTKNSRHKAQTTKVGILIGILGMIAILAATHLGGAERLEPRVLNISLGGEPMMFDVGFFANRCLTNICVFFTKNFVNAQLHPEAYLLISARVVHERITKSALRERTNSRRFSVSSIGSF